MTGTPVHLVAPRYELGEHCEDHRTIAALEERTRKFGMQPMPELWGWGSVYRTDRGIEELAVAAGAACLAGAGVDPAGVDLLVLCSTRFPGGPDTHGSLVEGVVRGLGLSDPECVGVTLGRCTNLLAAIRLAEASVAAARVRRALVVTTDRIEDEALRVEKFALFSDGAAACLVCAEPGPEGESYEITATAAAQLSAELDWSHEINPRLGQLVNERIFAACGVPVREVDGLLHPNLYTPIAVMKERQAGFSAAQLFTGNIPRLGHCFAADALINLADRSAAGQLRAGGRYLLASSVPGSRVGVLLRREP